MSKVKAVIWNLPVLRSILRRLDTLERQVAALAEGVNQITAAAPPVSPKEETALDALLLTAKQWEGFAQELERTLPEQELLSLLWSLQSLVGKLAFAREERSRKFFYGTQKLGFSLVPVTYESPVPRVDAIPPWVWRHRFDLTPAFRLPTAPQWELLERIAHWGEEMSTTPEEAESGYFWKNNAFGPVEAVIYHCMIREFKPRRVLEVGAGYSTLVAVKAAAMNGTTRVEAVDPYPRPFLRNCPGVFRLWERPVQDVPLSNFERLEANDILFVDSSHVCATGSDVNFIVFEVLPRLKPGVLVHFHDIFLPWEYPEPWLKELRIFYNEQYLLLAFLMFNEAYEALLATRLLTMENEERIRKLFPFLPWIKACSFWMRRKPAAEGCGAVPGEA
ncbi:class I SAM-dependent methyltransferase [Thermogutta sp.]|uniref:class I SAM-dependent methyltransferase n=1 Tax=Thermogutta sp. TaxID=1962930 RepID=UPI003220745D